MTENKSERSATVRALLKEAKSFMEARSYAVEDQAIENLDELLAYYIERSNQSWVR